MPPKDKAVVTLEHVVVAQTAYEQLRTHYSSAGADRVIEEIKKTRPAFPLKRDAVFRILAGLKQGQAPGEIMATYGKGRGKGRTAATAALVAKVDEEVQEQPDTRYSSNRLLAKKHGVSRMTIQRVIKRVLKRPTFKRVKTCANTAAQLEKRAKMSAKILKGAESGKYDLGSIFWTDESWFDTTGNRYNPQNWRVIGAPGQKKTNPNLQAALAVPQVQRGRGVMVHMTVSAYNGGTVLQPHLVPAGTNINGEYYSKNVLQNDVLPKIRAAVMGAGGDKVADWTFMHDLAPPHTALVTQKTLKDAKVKVLPWFPKGADVNPLDLFVWNSIKEELGKVPLASRNTVPKLQATLTCVISKMAADPAWVKKVRRSCKSASKRLRWIRDNDGKQIVGKPWRQ